MIIPEVTILNFAIHKKYQQQGFGSQLLKYLIKQLKNKGCNKIFLEVDASNEIAQNIYKKFGFQFLYIRKKYYSNGKDAIVMVLEPQ